MGVVGVNALVLSLGNGSVWAYPLRGDRGGRTLCRAINRVAVPMTTPSPRLVFDLRGQTARGCQTTRRLAILIDGVAVWPVPGDETARLDIQIDDLLGHLTDHWKPLMLRQTCPTDPPPQKPSDLRRNAERRWADLPSAVTDGEQEAVRRFEDTHDIARAFGGIYGLPPFWILRAGPDFVVETGGRHWRLPFEDVRAALTLVGDQICGVLEVVDRERWEAAVGAWGGRNVILSSVPR